MSQPVHDNLDYKLVHGHEMQIRAHGSEPTDDLIAEARGFMVELVKECEFNQIPHLEREHRLHDGTLINVRLSYGVQQIDIFPPDFEGGTAGFYMDTGAIYEPYSGGVWASTITPLNLHSSNYIVNHNNSGVSYDGEQLTFLPKIGEEVTLCNEQYAPYWTEQGAVSTVAGQFKSAVFLENDSLNVLNNARKSWRYSGLARLFVQAKHGSGKIATPFLFHPDTSGIISTTDGRVYSVRFGQTIAHIRKLKVNISSCVLEDYAARSWGDPVKAKLLAYLFSQAELDLSVEETLVDISSISNYGSPLCYGWHWPYDLTAESSKIDAKLSSDGLQLDMTRTTVKFIIPSVEAELEGAQVAISIDVVNEGGYWPGYSGDIFWTSVDEDHYTIRNLASLYNTPVDSVGDNVGIYCFYGKSGLQVLTFTKPSDETQDAIEDTTRYCGEGTAYALRGWTYGDQCSPPPPWVTNEDAYTETSGGYIFDGNNHFARSTNSHYKRQYTWVWSGLSFYNTRTGADYADFSATSDACDWVRIAECTHDCSDFEAEYAQYDASRTTRIEITTSNQVGQSGISPAANNPDSICVATKELEELTGTGYNYLYTSSGTADNFVRPYNVVTVVSGQLTQGKEGPNRPCSTYIGTSQGTETLDYEVTTYTATLYGVEGAYNVTSDNDDWHYLYSGLDEVKSNLAYLEESFNGAAVHTDSAKDATYKMYGGLNINKSHIDGLSMLYFGWM